MSRGFDGLEIDAFHGPERDGNRSPDPDSRSGWAAVRRLERIRGEAERADQRNQEARGASGGNRSPLTLAYYLVGRGVPAVCNHALGKNNVPKCSQI